MRAVEEAGFEGTALGRGDDATLALAVSGMVRATGVVQQRAPAQHSFWSMPSSSWRFLPAGWSLQVCSSCVGLVEEALARQPGVQEAKANLLTGRAEVWGRG